MTYPGPFTRLTRRERLTGLLGAHRARLTILDLDPHPGPIDKARADYLRRRITELNAELAQLEPRPRRRLDTDGPTEQDPTP